MAQPSASYPTEPTDLGPLAVLERQIILDVNAKDFAAAANTRAKVNPTWERVKPLLRKVNALMAIE